MLLPTVVLASMLGPGVARAGEADPGMCKMAPPSLARLGYRALPPELARADVAKLKSAKKAVAKAVATKNWSAAKKLLEPLAAAYSEDPEVRFLLAMERASEGELSDACGEIAHLLEWDLPSFGQRYAKEPAFTGLRQSPEGARLAEHAKAVAALWRQAASDGLPSLMARGTRDALDIWSATYLRGGVYLHAVKRFLPMAPPVDGAAAVLVHPRANRTTVVSLKVDPCRDDNCPKVEAVDVRDFALDDIGRPPVRWHYDGENAQPLELRSGAGGLEAKVHDCCCYDNCVSPWEKVGGKRSSRKPTPPSGQSTSTIEEMTLRVDHRGFLLATTPASVRIRKGSLVSDDQTVPLDPRHADAATVHDVLLDPSTGARLVLSTVDGCQCGSKREGAALRHVLSRVTPDGKAAVLVSSQGPAAALLDGGGAFYLQTGDTVRRWPSMAAVGTHEGEPILSGVVLVVPVTQQRNCCGL